MRYLPVIVLTILISSTSLFAQKKSKEEKALAKEWKARKKKMNPLDLKNLEEGKEALTAEIAKLESDQEEVVSQLSTKDTEIASIKEENNKLRLEGSKSSKKVDESGIIYKVQIGAFRELDLTEQTASGDLKVEETEDGIKRYTIGRFRDLEGAKKFQSYIQRMGVRDAFIVGFRDGVRDENLVDNDH